MYVSINFLGTFYPISFLINVLATLHETLCGFSHLKVHQKQETYANSHRMLHRIDAISLFFFFTSDTLHVTS